MFIKALTFPLLIVKNYMLLTYYKFMKNHRNILNDLNLLKKYDVYAYDYIEYPHKSYWQNDIEQEVIFNKLEKLIENQTPTMLYVHIPFCEQLCTFCICHRQITSDYGVALDYLKSSLFLEIDLMKKVSLKVGKNFNIKEVYFGGGSPTFLKENEFKMLKEKLLELTSFENLNQFSVEIDPRRVEEERLLFYAEMGVNKLSFGVQDFDLEVQKKINRIQPTNLIERLLTKNVREKFKSINFDLLVGLPGQTKESIKSTISEVIRLRPDRIALAYLAYNPDFHPHQRHMMIKEVLPDFYRRKEIFVEALDTLIQSSYVRTGFEHFALPEDDVSRSINKKKAYYNSFGAVTGDCTSVLALGRSSYSTIGDDLYYQNHYKQNEYQTKLANGLIPIERGWTLDQDTIIRREIIKQIRTYFEVDVDSLSEKFSINFSKYFKTEIEKLDSFFEDGLMFYDEKKIKLTENGKHFANLIGSNFDKFINSQRYDKNIKIKKVN